MKAYNLITRRSLVQIQLPQPITYTTNPLKYDVLASLSQSFFIPKKLFYCHFYQCFDKFFDTVVTQITQQKKDVLFPNKVGMTSFSHCVFDMKPKNEF